MNYDHYISDVVKEIPPSGIRKYFDLLDDNYVSVTYLLNNEFAVTLVIAIDDLPKEIEKELELC